MILILKNSRKNLAQKDLKKRITKSVIWIVATGAALSMTIFIVFMSMGVSFFLVSGDSMNPSLKHNDVIMLKKDKGVSKDQIFVFTKPKTWGYMGDDRPNLIKRVAAAPGDTLEYDGKAFFVNGEEIFNTEEENYECKLGNNKYSHTLSTEEIFVMGDNASKSLDSRRIFCDGEEDKIFIKKRNMVDNGYIERIL